jgi:hypothetical protein
MPGGLRPAEPCASPGQDGGDLDGQRARTGARTSVVTKCKALWRNPGRLAIHRMEAAPRGAWSPRARLARPAADRSGMPPRVLCRRCRSSSRDGLRYSEIANRHTIRGRASLHRAPKHAARGVTRSVFLSRSHSTTGASGGRREAWTRARHELDARGDARGAPLGLRAPYYPPPPMASSVSAEKVAAAPGFARGEGASFWPGVCTSPGVHSEAVAAPRQGRASTAARRADPAAAPGAKGLFRDRPPPAGGRSESLETQQEPRVRQRFHP